VYILNPGHHAMNHL